MSACFCYRCRPKMVHEIAPKLARSTTERPVHQWSGPGLTDRLYAKPDLLQLHGTPGPTFQWRQPDCWMRKQSSVPRSEYAPRVGMDGAHRRRGGRGDETERASPAAETRSATNLALGSEDARQA